MKRVLILMSIFTLLTIGCSKSEKKPAGSPGAKPAGSPEKTLVGKWNSSTTKGFVAEFKKDHTGITISPDPASANPPAEIPFKWTIESDGRLKISEGKSTYFGKIEDKKLELDLGGAKTVLQKAN